MGIFIPLTHECEMNREPPLLCEVFISTSRYFLFWYVAVCLFFKATCAVVFLEKTEKSIFPHPTVKSQTCP